MSRRINFPTGYQVAIADWVAEDFAFALMTDAWTQDETTEVFMADINANETTAPEYARSSVTTKSMTIVLPTFVDGPGYIQLHGDDPTFGTLSGGDIITSLVLFQDTGSDATSLLVSSFPCYYEANDLYDIAFVVSSQGQVVASTKCV